MPLTPHQPKQITVHHSGVKSAAEVNLSQKMQALQRYSQSAAPLANGQSKAIWGDVPYHFVIAPSGEIAEGRELHYAGDTNTRYDTTGHVLISLLGNFEEQEPTPAQIQALLELSEALSKAYDLPAQSFAGHQDHAETLCPGKHLIQQMPGLKKALLQRSWW